MKRIGPYLVLLLLLSCNPPGESQNENLAPVTAFTNVNVIPMDENHVLENQTVLISEGKITAIGDATSIKVPEQATMIDGTGKFLIPGLAEMHAHIPGTNASPEYLENTLFLYLSNGVTTIRGMLGQPSHLELREKAANNEILSPRIFTSGPSLNGNTVKTPEDAQKMVTEQKEAGYDFLKLHPGIQLEVFNELVASANEVGIPFSGHVSVHVGIRKAIEAQYGSVDHLDGYLEGLVPESANVDPTQNGFFGFNFVKYADLSLLDDLSVSTAAKNVWVVPTHALMKRWAGSLSPDEIGAEPEMKYMPRQTLEAWINNVKQFQSNAAYTVENAIAFIELRDKILKSLYDAGVGMLLGSDAPQIFNVPGFSIQHELKAMVDAGIPNYDALKSGTLNPAIFFGKENEFGMVKAGHSADLILLNANPLDDISAISSRSGVMVRGRWMPESEIQQRLAEIAAQNGY